MNATQQTSRATIAKIQADVQQKRVKIQELKRQLHESKALSMMNRARAGR